MTAPSRLDQALKIPDGMRMGDVVRKQTRPTCQTYVWLWALVSMLSWEQTGWGQSDEYSDDEGTAFIDQYCVDCHQPPKPKGKLDLTLYTTVDQIVADALDWDSHLNRVRDEDMPR